MALDLVKCKTAELWRYRVFPDFYVISVYFDSQRRNGTPRFKMAHRGSKRRPILYRGQNDPLGAKLNIGVKNQEFTVPFWCLETWVLCVFTREEQITNVLGEKQFSLR